MQYLVHISRQLAGEVELVEFGRGTPWMCAESQDYSRDHGESTPHGEDECPQGTGTKAPAAQPPSEIEEQRSGE